MAQLSKFYEFLVSKSVDFSLEWLTKAMLIKKRAHEVRINWIAQRNHLGSNNNENKNIYGFGYLNIYDASWF